MRIHVLRIEEFIALLPEPRHEVYERNLAGVCAYGEHAFPEKSGSDRNAIDAAGKHGAVPGFDAMRAPPEVQGGIKGDNFFVDPGCLPRVGAVTDNTLELRVESHAVGFLCDRPCEASRHMQACDRQYSPHGRIIPGDLRRAAVFRHRENARPVSIEQQIWGDFDHGDVLFLLFIS
jgi:hypothetical protein